ncbi:translation initiation factor IF-2 [Texcoconibacillus texcoconensis]|uniref:Translation initiation factor IF-2 n=1 Tax=Texcoconibacillus texcoconensis TaxID=1095777 RepID=A0A840QI56_9BACI|nr:translation initiation factor IF-2 [Texcoconibacillus texcoconensis]MBB5172034.1 translation initiation factor IF-2 [Texcoconibacillus texcoconensis]
MSKMRIYEYAKNKNLTSKQVLSKLEELGVSVSNHMSVIQEDTMKKLDQSLGNRSSDKQEQGTKKEGQPSQQQNSNQQSNQQSKSKPSQGQQNKKDQSKGKKVDKNKKGRGGGNRQNQGPRSQNKRDNANQMPSKITYTAPISVGEFAEKLNKEPSEIIKKLMFLGVMATINQELDKDTIELLVDDYGIEAEEEVVVDETDLSVHIEKDDPAKLTERPPVVTIMGHVDHGKTTLLDSIRHTKVTAGEAGGITQHIGAYQVEESGQKITFLDTPGHAAFTTMRARGAQVTDITILVVAADDGVMPQTVEAINHAKAAEVPIIVAVNKTDKEGANPDRVMQELTEHGLVAEAWGGDTIFVNVSALQAKGIDELLEMILLVAEVEELKASADKVAYGTVVEAELDKGRGPVATLLVQEGTLEVGDPLVVGHTHGRVRAMVNDIGRRVKTAGPSTPVEITGLNSVPSAGDPFIVFKDEKKARQIGEARATQHREAERKETSRVSLDDLFEQIQQGDIKEINVIIKADVQGSVEALRGSLEKIEVEGVKVNIIHAGAGAIAESDIILASASNAIIIGFNVRPDANANRVAESEKVDVRLHRVIYDAIEEIESAMKGMLDPVYQEKVIGQAEVRQTFKVSRIGTIAGSYLTDGYITRDSSIRLIRDGVVQFDGGISHLKRYKDDVKEVRKGYECGITLENYNDIKEGDILEAYIMEEIKPS